MFLKFIKKYQTKTLLAGAGFLVLAGITGFLVWFYFNFLVSRDSFLNAAPAEVKLYWHWRGGEADDLFWLETLSQKLLTSEASEQTKFVFQKLADNSPEISFAILPGFEDFLFWGKIDLLRFNEVKPELEAKNLNYISDQSGQITVANSRFALQEALSVLSGKNFSLADNRVRLASFSRATRHSSAQIYFSGNFQYGDFESFSWKSDFWSKNNLIIEGETSQPENLLAFDLFIRTDNDFVAQNAENILKNYLAVLLPEKRDRVLPDKTVVKEIVANPNLFKFEDREVADQKINYLFAAPLDQGFFLARIKDSALLGNSLGLLSFYFVNLKPEVNYYGKNLIELVFAWLKWITPDFGGIIFSVNSRL